jgi:prepilin-type N-terminal cleavage/methylation domain-containing protein
MEMGARNRHDERGFTLVELLLTIVVVGILASIAIVGFGGLTDTATRATCKPTMDAARTAVTSYWARQTPNAYPSDFNALVASHDLELLGGVQNPTPATLTDGSATARWTITLDPVTGTLSATGTAAAGCA